ANTAALTAHTAARRDRLYAEIVARIQETDLSVPALRSGWWYYNRTVEGLQYLIHCRKPAPDDCPGLDDRPTDPTAIPGDEIVLLDQNLLAEGHEFFSLGGLELSPDSRLLAYSTDTTGGERYTLRFRDVTTGVDLEDTISDTYYGLAWASDSATVFYTRPDEAMRPHQLWRHRLGTAATDDVLVYTEDDERFWVGVGRTKDDAFVVLDLGSKVTSEVRVLRADEPGGTWRTIEPRRQGVEYGVEHRGSQFLIVTNDGAENFRLVHAPEAAPGRSHWEEAIPHDPAVRLQGIDVFEAHLVLYERSGGYRRIRVADLDGDGLPVAPSLRTVEQPEVVSTAWGGANPELGSATLRYEYTSLVTPRSVYDYDLLSGEATLLKRQPVLGGYDPGGYRTERLWAPAPDGEQVPISIVYREGTERDGTAPCLLYGYGSYEHSLDPSFSSLRLSLLDRGFVLAVAHVRGGGELGRPWYEAGKLLSKPSTFSDFIACARHLVAEGWTTAQRLVARGGSAGGLLMGAVANAAPEAFGAIVAEVPFVDCLTTILDESLPLTVTEWEEWGNPVADPAVYAAMKAYSPYDNVGPHPYPRLLVTAGLNDPRVSYWEPAKWVQRIRAVSPTSTVLLKTEMGAGHQGPSGRYDAWRDEAFVLAFVLDAAGCLEPDAPAGPGLART
ncbi:MAG: S9 family peptidase, partial [Acidimicrobiales bacterium]